MIRRAAALMLPLLAALGFAAPANAYRPFDGTDAAVAAPGEAEIELGPAEYLREEAVRTLIAPSLRLNLGIVPGTEVTLEGKATHTLSPPPRSSSLLDNAIFLKSVLRAGALQNAAGPSIATEWGVLLPGINGDPGVGATGAGIISERWSWGTTHLNLEATLTRRQHADLFLDAIVEGPPEWPVRPVAEIFHEREFGGERSFSALVGAIWQLSDTLAFDVGVRGARLRSGTVGELRAGVTFTLPVW